MITGSSILIRCVVKSKQASKENSFITWHNISQSCIHPSIHASYPIRSLSRIREPTARRHNRRRERRRNLPPPSSSSSSSHQGGQRRRDRERRSMPGHLESSSGGTRSDLQSSNAYSEDESGTRSYHHPIPGLSKGYRREGGRRKRRDSLSDSDGEETRYS